MAAKICKNTESATNDQISIEIISLTGQKIYISNLKMHKKVKHLKRLLYQNSGIPSTQQKLTFKNRELIDDEELSTYGIYEGAKVHLVPNIRSGPLNFHLEDLPVRRSFSTPITVQEKCSSDTNITFEKPTKSKPSRIATRTGKSIYATSQFQKRSRERFSPTSVTRRVADQSDRIRRQDELNMTRHKMNSLKLKLSERKIRKINSKKTEEELNEENMTSTFPIVHHSVSAPQVMACDDISINPYSLSLIRPVPKTPSSQSLAKSLNSSPATSESTSEGYSESEETEEKIVRIVAKRSDRNIEINLNDCDDNIEAKDSNNLKVERKLSDTIQCSVCQKMVQHQILQCKCKLYFCSKHIDPGMHDCEKELISYY